MAVDAHHSAAVGFYELLKSALVQEFKRGSREDFNKMGGLTIRFGRWLGSGLGGGAVKYLYQTHENL